MCLEIDRRKTNLFSRKNSEKDLIFIKKFEITNFNKLITYYQNSFLYNQNGYFIAKGLLNVCFNIIYGGCIHAFINKKSLKPHLYKIKNDNEYVHNIYEKIIYLTIKVHSEDIIAFGKDCDVCFLKYKFTEKSEQTLKKLGIKI